MLSHLHREQIKEANEQIYNYFENYFHISMAIEEDDYKPEDYLLPVQWHLEDAKTGAEFDVSLDGRGRLCYVKGLTKNNKWDYEVVDSADQLFACFYLQVREDAKC